MWKSPWPRALSHQSVKEAIMNGDAIIQRLAQRIAQLIAENEILKQELLEIKEANDGECKQDTES